MKRYLIYGFLTILIITLNFAFIIVLVTDDVRINYRVLFLLWLVVLLAAGGLAYLEKTRKNRNNAELATKPITPEANSEPEEKSRFSNIYKNKCIKKAKVKLPEDLTNKVAPGFFIGYVENEEYSSETVQAVYTSNSQLLGYINRKKEQLCENIELLYNEPVVCWGNILWNDEEKRFIAKVHVPILYSEPETNRFKKMARLKEELLTLEESSENFDVYRLLEKAENFYYFQQSEITPPSLDYSIDPEIIPRLSKELLKAKRWEELIQLKKYPILVSRIKEPEKKEVHASIKKAEKKLEA